jgi:cellulose synthase/poly-beta-1,6-N-acetylglucosamine synthase-like glycosyltransferase
MVIISLLYPLFTIIKGSYKSNSSETSLVFKNSEETEVFEPNIVYIKEVKIIREDELISINSSFNESTKSKLSQDSFKVDLLTRRKVRKSLNHIRKERILSQRILQPENHEQEFKTYIKTFNHNHLNPDEGTQYFLPIEDIVGATKVAVVITFYNEEKLELKRTLASLYAQEKESAYMYRNAKNEKNNSLEFYYLAVMDGYYEASNSMIEYISEIFGDEFDENFGPYDKDDCTKIVSKITKTGYMGSVNISPGKTLKLAVIIKKQNRKKLNSHEWFFKAFLPHCNARYAFTTDCGTLFGKLCLYRLLNYLEENEQVAAVTGRQRVMSLEMQGFKAEGLQAMWYRAAQAYDYEASISAFQGAFSLCGMLPVLPGPCAMFRCSDIHGECLNYYINFVKKEKDKNGLVSGNVMLAEDRILSFAASLMTGKYTQWVPSAVFYFQAETESKLFIAQRRRWTNGTFYCYFYLLFMEPKLLYKASKHSKKFRIVIYIQILVQWLLYCITSVSPGIFATLLYFGILDSIDSQEAELIAKSFLALYAFLYNCFCITHFFVKYVSWLYNSVLFLNTLLFFYVLLVNLTALTEISLIAIGIFLSSLIFPLLLALLHDLEVFMLMLFNFIPFFFFLPTFVPWFSSYSLARTWDLSWGNRPRGRKSIYSVMTSVKLKSFVILSMAIMVNHGLCGLLVYRKSKKLVIFLTAGITSFSMIQQACSFYYYIFHTEHMMFSTMKTLKENTIKILNLALFFVTVILITVSIYTTSWLTHEVEVFVSKNQTGITLNSTSTVVTDGKVTKNHTFYPEKVNLIPLKNIYTIEKEETNIETTLIFLKKEKLNLDHYFGIAGTKLFVVDYYYNSTKIVHEVTNFSKKVTNLELGDFIVNSTNNFITLIENVHLIVEDTKRNAHTVEHPVSSPQNFIKSFKSEFKLPKTVLTSNTKFICQFNKIVLDGVLKIAFGILYVSLEWHTKTKFDNQKILWWTGFLNNVPNNIWAFSVCFILAGFIFLLMSLLVLLYSFTDSKGNSYDVSVFHSTIGLVSIIVGACLFPFSLRETPIYYSTWWSEPTLGENKMCGNNTGFGNGGACKIGWSYITFIFSCIVALLSYSIQRYTVDKKCREYVMETRKNKENIYPHIKSQYHVKENDTKNLEDYRCFPIDHLSLNATG